MYTWSDMRPLVLFLSVFLIPGFPASTYEDLLARLKGGDLNIDFTELRHSCLQSAACDPVGNREAWRAAMQALADKRNTQALELARAFLESAYVNVDAHMTCERAYEATGDKAKAKYHHEVAAGLIKSILGSGQGSSPKTAYKVISTREEYVVLAVMGRRAAGQALMEVDGHRYDRLDTEDPKSGTKAAVFFNIDGFFGKRR